MYIYCVGGGLYMYIYSGAGESPVFQSAVYAGRAHVLVLASDRISLYKKKRKKIKKDTSMAYRSETLTQVEFLQSKQHDCGFFVFHQSNVLQV
jgi:hypothetical protein